MPPDLVDGQPYYSRAEIADGALSGRGLELIWLDDPIAAFFLQVQGSAQIALESGETYRLSYGAKNGHNYQSIGRVLIKRGHLDAQTISAQSITEWLKANPDQQQDIFNCNPSYVFFKPLHTDHASGPIGAMGRPVHALRSVAVDPSIYALGLPIYINTDAPNPIQRLMVAQDIGSAIKGAHRFDIFFGTGDVAGDLAGHTNAGGTIHALLPMA